MAAFTFSDPQTFAAPATKTKKPSFLRMFFESLVEARMIEAKMRVNSHLLSLDDETLARYGVDRADVEAEGYRPDHH